MNVMNKRRLQARLLRNKAFAEGGDGGTGNPAPTGDAAAPPDAQAPETQITAPAWHESIQDEGLKAFIADKGFKDAGEAVKALQDAEGRTAVPESPDAYQLPVPQGQDGSFAQQAAAWMHEAGVPVAQAQALAEKWNTYQAELQQQADVARQQRDEADVTTLRKEWGGQYDANVELGRRAVRAFAGEGDSVGELLGQIEGAIGAAETLRLFHRIGSQLNEGTLTPAATGASQQSGESMTDRWYSKPTQ